MEFEQTIALASDLLADGRTADVLQMIDPLLASHDAPQRTARLRALAARVAVTDRCDAPRALELLAPFRERAARATLSDTARADVALWLGWALALRTGSPADDAHALSLLDEAEQQYAALYDVHGQGWALLGQAQAYFAIDEYHLMRRALREAKHLQRALNDVLATRWLCELRIPALRFEGRYDEARAAIERLRSLQPFVHDRRVKGHAYAHEAAVDYDTGAPPERIVEAATQAATLLGPLATDARYPLLTSYHARIGALLRSGADEEAERCIAAALDAMDDYPVGTAHLQTLRARRALRQGAPERAEALLRDLFAQAHHLPHGLQRSHVALLRGELLARRGATDEALRWMERALQNAQETGHRGHQLQALLTLAATALRAQRPETAQRYLKATAQYKRYFGVLPFAAQRFAVLARAADDAPDAYRCLAAQAYRRMGDAQRADALAVPSYAVTDHLAPLLTSAAPCLPLVASLWHAADGTEASTLVLHAADGETRWRVLAGSVAALPDAPPPPDAVVNNRRWVRLYADDTHAVYWCGPPDDDRWTARLEALAPWRPVVALALEQSLRARPPVANEPSNPLPALVAESTAMQAVLDEIRHIHASHHAVLISGEGGVGKSLVAQALHRASARHDAAYHEVECASMQRIPLAERLFGRAGDPASGAFRRAAGGTLVLRNIDALPNDLQRRLLRVLRRGTIFPEGSEAPEPVDVRVVATAPHTLADHVRRGDFRSDLYDELGVIRLRVPPLRERRADIPVLVRHFLRALTPEAQSIVAITNRALRALRTYNWPGNVRQLRNEIERALLLVRSEPAPTIDLRDLSASITERDDAAEPAASPNDALEAILAPNETLRDVLARTETAVIERVLRACDGQVTASADVLGLSRQGLYKKMKRLNIDAAAFHSEAAAAS
ncbi:sigma-54-dependent Fis family transcriptional regulator [Salisaeta longa]|uniref:sigma-54-dependent Fis family transcriptional regulator n=1 Tax=Salisaeta longa TaxID=503170 RepID=UPI0003B42D32|nr:sigma-54-dependent Fis family transcriptional regulator [Salisaeta longa]